MIPVLPVGHALSGTLSHIPAPPLRDRLPAATLPPLARRLGAERLQTRTRRAETRLREIAAVTRTFHEAWDQLLYEGLMEAMGFAKNRMPFLFLARGVHLGLLRRTGLENREEVEAVLFGAGGLIPPLPTVSDPESRAYVRRLQRRWAKLRPGLRVPHLLPADWLFFRLRPANFPPVRLAGMAALLPALFGHGGITTLLHAALDEAITPASWWRRARDLFGLPPDPFWSVHVRFGPPAGRRRHWIGRERLLDIAANLLIPCALLLSRHNGDGPGGLRRCTTLLASLPPASSRTLLRSLEPSCTGTPRPASLLEHQGLIELALRR